jgi:hypothetical protein
MHAVGGRSGVEDVIVAEDFTFAPSSVMGDDVTGLWFPACDAVEALTFFSLCHEPDRSDRGQLVNLSGPNGQAKFAPVPVARAADFAFPVHGKLDVQLSAVETL